MNKIAIVILSDPKHGGEEALGRLFNGFAAAYDIKQSGGEISIFFQGTGTRWPSLIIQQQHPAHGLYEALKDNIVGVSSGCADVFGAAEDAVASGFELIKESLIPGTSGVPSIAKLLESGTTVLSF
jgi:hypothetical protein